MMARDLPLGIDIGATRVRIARACATVDGPRICAVAVRSLASHTQSAGNAFDAQYLGALIEDALTELRTRQRRCVASLGEPDALLRSIHFPKMTSAERERSARFEAQRHVDFPIEEALVRIHRPRAGAHAWTLGVARSSAVNARVTALRAAKLKVAAIDHEACALARALPGFDAILDIGYRRVSLHVVTAGAPVTLQAFTGGADITRAIERELSIDERSAEKRKRILGTAGAGERARSTLTADVAGLIRSARRQHQIVRIALVGNAARLPRLAADIEGSTGVLCEMPVSEALRDGEYPEDVVRSSAPDWNLAVGLAMWEQP